MGIIGCKIERFSPNSHTLFSTIYLLPSSLFPSCSLLAMLSLILPSFYYNISQSHILNLIYLSHSYISTFLPFLFREFILQPTIQPAIANQPASQSTSQSTSQSANQPASYSQSTSQVVNHPASQPTSQPAIANQPANQSTSHPVNQPSSQPAR